MSDQQLETLPPEDEFYDLQGVSPAGAQEILRRSFEGIMVLVDELGELGEGLSNAIIARSKEDPQQFRINQIKNGGGRPDSYFSDFLSAEEEATDWQRTVNDFASKQKKPPIEEREKLSMLEKLERKKAMEKEAKERGNVPSGEPSKNQENLPILSRTKELIDHGEQLIRTRADGDMDHLNLMDFQIATYEVLQEEREQRRGGGLQY